MLQNLMVVFLRVCDRMKSPRSQRADRAPGRGHKAGEGSADRRVLTGRFSYVRLDRLTYLTSFSMPSSSTASARKRLSSSFSGRFIAIQATPRLYQVRA